MILNMHYQRGTVLVISLVMLVAMTLIAITSINMSTINLRIVGNMQSQMEAEVAVQNAIETVISDLSKFDASIAENVTVAGYTVAIDTRCLLTGPAMGYEATYSINETAGNRYDNDWGITAENSAGAISGEFASITQGVRVREVLSACP